MNIYKDNNNLVRLPDIKRPGPESVLVIILLLCLASVNSCITPFIPEITDQKELLVVQGLITDQPETNTIKLTKSLPFGEKTAAIPVSGCYLQISDDLGNYYSLNEKKPGTYITDSTIFKGEIGRTYTLHIARKTTMENFHYESYPMEMKPVPSIDSVYYEKTIIKEPSEFYPGINGCQIYLDTHDPDNKCKYYRWDYSETWKLRLNFDVPNQTCYISNRSDTINIKSTAAFEQDRITRHPLNYISNQTDRLKTKYSILVNQYSLNEDEYRYWENVQNLTVQVGGLSDIIPSSIPSNLYCLEEPEEVVLGYFSVSAKSSKRIFIKEKFEGIIDPYANCVTDTIYTNKFPELNISIWILLTHNCSMPCVPSYEITTFPECADCTFRGTTTKPSFWIDDK